VERWDEYLSDILRGLPTTVTTTVFSTALAMVVGLLVAILRMHRSRAARSFAAAYVEILRGSPILVQLFTIFFALPIVLSIYLPAYPAAVLALGLNAGGYMSEHFRAAFEAVPPGQRDAAASLGMSRLVVLRRVVVPEALPALLPSIGSMLVFILLATPLTALVGNPEMMYHAVRVSNLTHDFSVFALVSLVYAAITGVLLTINGRLERTLRITGVQG
jgi:His/Glu/Gln/Arg/opine family amino acid ABC transporter permease subunit